MSEFRRSLQSILSSKSSWATTHRQRLMYGVNLNVLAERRAAWVFLVTDSVSRMQKSGTWIRFRILITRLPESRIQKYTSTEVRSRSQVLIWRLLLARRKDKRKKLGARQWQQPEVLNKEVNTGTQRLLNASIH